ncbi:hypothetical protein GCM10010233_51460 [Streptomyces pseudogriseolus]|nr:hypothetical protein GCM10010233_51460 [Streptomyces gancidicus]
MGYVALAFDLHGGRWFTDPEEMLARCLPLLADPDRLREIGHMHVRCPVWAGVGSEDPIMPAGQRDAFATEMQAAGVDWRLVIYGGALHAFQLNRDSEMFRASRVAMYEAGEPLFTRAQEAGEARRDASFDDVLRMITGIIATGYVSDEQRGRVLRFALDGIRTDKD